LAEGQWEELAALIRDQILASAPAGRPVRLGAAQQVRLALEHLRNDVGQQVLAEHYAVSEPTVSRVIAATLPLVDEALPDLDHGLAQISPHVTLIVDRTLIPTRRRA
jgi:hypothetical protein